MNVNGISNQTSTYAAYKSTEQKAAATETEGKQTEVSAVYEPSAETEKTDTVTAKQKNEAIISRLKADAEARTQQLQQLVQQMISKQGNAYGQANDMWKFLASGNFTVDAQTKAQAQADIAEDGYWGVKQTSERIFDFAKALSGGDMDKMKEMQAAFEKGFKQATKTWGKELPQISQDTRSAVNKLFEDFYAGDQKDTE
ncbi:putative uncharacterized protein [Firmicutes bacterium CAG:194]|jgi:hypothetical protein|nr:putative uncharacterized protein [Firmicutes bacterium CAG:194]